MVDYGGAVITKSINGNVVDYIGWYMHGGFTPDGPFSSNSTLTGPTSADIAADGTVYIAEPTNHRVRAVHPNNTISTVAGNGQTSETRTDASNAAQTAFNEPTFIKIGPDGLLYVVDGGLIRRINADGTTTIVAGKYGATAQSDPYVEGAIATDHFLPSGNPDSLAKTAHLLDFDAQGRLYITSHTTIFRLDHDQTIHTVFTSQPYAAYEFNPEPTPIAEKTLNGGISGFAIAPDGTIWLGVNNGTIQYDSNGLFMRNYTAIFYIRDGIIAAAAGGGRAIIDATTPGWGQDMTFANIIGLDVGDDNNIYFAQGGLIFNPYATNTGSYFGRLSTNSDLTPPVINFNLSAPLNEFDWANAPTTITWDVSDPESTITSITGCQTATITTDTFEFASECSATSNGGTNGNSKFVRVDTTAPSINSLAFSTNPKPTMLESTLTINAFDPRPGSHVRRGEYYIGDTDPGQGNGSQIPVSEYFDDGRATLSTTYGTDFAPGVYKINVRTQDFASNWSTTTVDYLVVQDQTGTKKLTGKKSIIPSLGNSDIMPGLIDPSQTDKATFGLTINRDAQGQISPNSDFQLQYETGSHCNSPNQAVNCHTLELNATAINWLITQGSNDSVGIFQGTADVTIDGALYSLPFKTTAIDGDLRTPVEDDQFELLIYPAGSNPNTATPMYRINQATIDKGNIKLQ